MTTTLPSFNCDLTDDHDNSHSMDDRVLSVREILAGKAPQDAPVTVKGWVRTQRGSKAGISFVHLFGWIVFSSGAGSCAEHIAQLCR